MRRKSMPPLDKQKATMDAKIKDELDKLSAATAEEPESETEPQGATVSGSVVRSVFRNRPQDASAARAPSAAPAAARAAAGFDTALLAAEQQLVGQGKVRPCQFADETVLQLGSVLMC